MDEDGVQDPPELRLQGQPACVSPVRLPHEELGYATLSQASHVALAGAGAASVSAQHATWS